MNRKHPVFEPQSMLNRLQERFPPRDRLQAYFSELRRKAAHRRSVSPAAEPPVRRSSGRQAATGRHVAPATFRSLIFHTDSLPRPMADQGATGFPATSCRSWALQAVDGDGDVDARLRRSMSGQGEDPFVIEMQGLPVSRVKCRALIIEPEILQRLRQAHPPLDPDNDAEALRQVFEERVLRQNLEVCRILSALPVLDGNVSPHGTATFEEWIPSDCPDPLQDTYLVVLFDAPSATGVTGGPPVDSRQPLIKRCHEWLQERRVLRILAAAAAACLIFVLGSLRGEQATQPFISELKADVRNLRSENENFRNRIQVLHETIELAGLPTAMVASLSSAGRDSIKVEGSLDHRYVEGAELRIADTSYPLDLKQSKAPFRLEFSEDIHVALDGRELAAVVEFYPTADAVAKLPQFFGPERRTVTRRFLASRSGLITDPQAIDIPAEVDQLVNAREYQDPGRQRNRYVVTGQLYQPVDGMHGWLIIEPVFADNKFVGSRLSADGSRFIARCYLGNDDIDGQPYRIWCVFHNSADALKPGQELPPSFDWTFKGEEFIKTSARYKINDGNDRFDTEPNPTP